MSLQVTDETTPIKDLNRKDTKNAKFYIKDSLRSSCLGGEKELFVVDS